MLKHSIITHLFTKLSHVHDTLLYVEKENAESVLVV